MENNFGPTPAKVENYHGPRQQVPVADIVARNYNLDIKNPNVVEEDHGDPRELLAKLEESEAETAKLRDKLRIILEEALLR